MARSAAPRLLLRAPGVASGPLLVGMVHLLPLPGSPAARSMDEVVARALADAATWRRGGAGALLVENFGDAPFHPDAVPPITIAAMARVAAAIVADVALPLGVNVLRNDAAAALSIATACGLAFLRVNVHAGAAVTDQGLLVGRAHETLRLRAALRSSCAIWADVRVKHAAPLAPRPLADEARELVERAGADALLVTGPATGRPPREDDLAELARALPRTPLVLASGADPDVIAAHRDRLSAVIAGTFAKRGGDVRAAPDRRRVRALADACAGR